MPPRGEQGGTHELTEEEKKRKQGKPGKCPKERETNAYERFTGRTDGGGEERRGSIDRFYKREETERLDGYRWKVEIPNAGLGLFAIMI